MAIVKAITASSGKLYPSIRYITRADKTRPDLIGGWNVDPQNAYAEMMDTKKQWGKMGGRTFKHFIQSFNPEDGITPEEANAIAGELIESSPLFDGYEVVYATHVDRDHIHTHIICNSVNIEDGSKFRYSRAQLNELKRRSDEIVHAHGYLLEHERGETENVTAWNRNLYQKLMQAHEGESDSWMYTAAVDIQEVMETAADREMFIQDLTQRGYQVQWDENSILFTTPEGYSVRDRNLESIFKLPSIRENYVDQWTMQTQLWSGLKDAAQEANVVEPEVHEGSFDLDLRRSPSWRSSGSLTDRRYETACAVCRMLRASGSIEEFIDHMQRGGYGVRYSAGAVNVTFITPEGTHVRSSFLEKQFDLPSIKAAMETLRYQTRKRINLYDAEIHPEMMTRCSGDDWNEILKQEGSFGVGIARDENALRFGSTVDLDNRCALMHMYQYSDSPMWDNELRAAAIVLGRAMCHPDQLDAYLADEGYQLWTGGGPFTVLVTPKGHYIKAGKRKDIEDVEVHVPKPPIHLGTVAVIADEFIREINRPARDSVSQVLDIITMGLLIAATLIELVAVLIGRGIEVQREKQKFKDYVIHTQRGPMSMMNTLSELGYADPEALRMPAAPAKHPARQSVVHTQTMPSSSPADLYALLLAVRKAVESTSDRDVFIRSMADQGYDMRWTKNGTVTFITPEGEHVRATRLEKRFHLPSIAAAYGQELHVPQKGPRPAAAALLQSTMERASTLDEFNTALRSSGYRIEWQTDWSDATITAPTGERMRLSSLERTFSLPSVKEIYGIQQERYEKEEQQPRSVARPGGTAPTVERSDIEGLRAAIAAAESTKHDNGAYGKGRYAGQTHSRSAGHDFSSPQSAGGRRQKEYRSRHQDGHYGEKPHTRDYSDKTRQRGGFER